MVGYAHVSVETMLKSARDWGEFVTMYLVKVALYCGTLKFLCACVCEHEVGRQDYMLDLHNLQPSYSVALFPGLHVLVSRGQTLFRTKGKGLGYGHRATCRPGI